MNTKYKVLKKIEGRNYSEKDEIADAYGSSLEHLADELKRLDLLLKLYIIKQQQPDLLNRNSEMALPAEYVFYLLCDEDITECDENSIAAELAMLEQLIAKRLEVSKNEGVYLSLPYISEMFNLNSFEERCIVACLANELDRKYEKIFGYCQNDMTAWSPSISNLMQLFASSDEEKILARPAFDRQAPLIRFFMDGRSDIMDSRKPLIARTLKLDDWVVNFLLGFQILDYHLMHFAKLFPSNGENKHIMLSETEENTIRFINYYRSCKEYKPKQIFYFHGPDEVGKTSHVMAVCRYLGLPLIIADVEGMLSEDMAFSELLRLLGRQVMLENGALCLENFDNLMTEDPRDQLKINMLLQMIATFAPLTFIFGEASWSHSAIGIESVFVDMEFPLPAENVRKAYWKKFSKEYRLAENVNLDDFTGSFQFTPGQIQAALNYGENLAVYESGNSLIGMEELYNACYAQSNSKLGTLTSKIKVLYDWGMLVLPDDQMSQLREICNQMKYRSVVYEEWGFDKRLSLGKGLNILFSGPPGSGKTMAAEVIARELGLEIFKIDVSQAISKYIGETEKNLARIFSEAATSNAILFFDEADALFGKRSEVKDAHDRYANIETSYLLQKMEEYKGIVILATNLNQNIDEAFLRRLHFSVEFPFPEKEQRKSIWQGMFPAGAPLDKDIDYDFLADKFVLAGGNIKNIALNAAFYAAHDSCQIGMKHIMLAARREYKKLGKVFLRSDFDPYYQLIEVM